MIVFGQKEEAKKLIEKYCFLLNFVVFAIKLAKFMNMRT